MACAQRATPSPTLQVAEFDIRSLKFATGIPISQLEFVHDPTLPGVMLHPSGGYVILKQRNAHLLGQGKKASTPEPEPDIPAEFRCPICKNMLSNAVLLACCGRSYCDSCLSLPLRPDRIGDAPARCP